MWARGGVCKHSPIDCRTPTEAALLLLLRLTNLRDVAQGHAPAQQVVERLAEGHQAGGVQGRHALQVRQVINAAAQAQEGGRACQQAQQRQGLRLDSPLQAVRGLSDLWRRGCPRRGAPSNRSRPPDPVGTQQRRQAGCAAPVRGRRPQLVAAGATTSAARDTAAPSAPPTAGRC